MRAREGVRNAVRVTAAYGRSLQAWVHAHLPAREKALLGR